MSRPLLGLVWYIIGLLCRLTNSKPPANPPRRGRPIPPRSKNYRQHDNLQKKTRTVHLPYDYHDHMGCLAEEHTSAAEWRNTVVVVGAERQRAADVAIVESNRLISAPSCNNKEKWVINNLRRATLLCLPLFHLFHHPNSLIL